ncbi:hypothetical protein PC116_g20098 [Phytophthora cactorum]|uniref:Uncharacterized protein n=1 Tax=Phytophthora cactorum TaxID=29920 RepID=A0A8T0YK08_9STRA|nr:hypothetical protein PC111_g18438 [Phytophthora cactorum]KAG2840244.1 hypothetical protein PC113_g19304 [Phytophthora cactorum]KAG2893977.1 hypothetical protein PC114_g16061 [Phytophthora cactorum]KAG2905262.1 hypothetical protein PC117_g20784 [Phytophthora cactorum]KAG2966838.1 hypothetical protein PC118_g18929 [Phytophthora cactorum]
MTTGSAVAVSGKRKNFTEEDDILLLKQVIADEPFPFPREKLAGTTAQNRVTLLIDAAKKKNTKEERFIRR